MGRVGSGDSGAIRRDEWRRGLSAYAPCCGWCSRPPSRGVGCRAVDKRLVRPPNRKLSLSRRRLV
eukprot:34039_5